MGQKSSKKRADVKSADGESSYTISDCHSTKSGSRRLAKVSSKVSLNDTYQVCNAKGMAPSVMSHDMTSS